MREEGRGKVVVGQISTLGLPDEEAEAAFALLLDAFAEEDYEEESDQSVSIHHSRCHLAAIMLLDGSGARYAQTSAEFPHRRRICIP